MKTRIFNSQKFKFAHRNEFEKEYLKPAFIDPLMELGFEFKGYGSLSNPDDSSGMHYLLFKETSDLPIPKRAEEYQKMIDIATQDDDGQPHATYQYYMGDLHIFIPYYG